MIIRNVTEAQIRKAGKIVAARYAGNVFVSECEAHGKGYRVRLAVRDGDAPGASITVHAYLMGWTPHARRTRSACWHAHGDFFDAVWTIEPSATIRAGSMTYASGSNVMRGPADNWQDWNRGSMVMPVMASECCQCGRAAWDKWPLARRR